jgi:hypothetical protein
MLGAIFDTKIALSGDFFFFFVKLYLTFLAILLTNFLISWIIIRGIWVQEKNIYRRRFTVISEMSCWFHQWYVNSLYITKSLQKKQENEVFQQKTRHILMFFSQVERLYVILSNWLHSLQRKITSDITAQKLSLIEVTIPLFWLFFRKNKRGRTVNHLANFPMEQKQVFHKKNHKFFLLLQNKG